MCGGTIAPVAVGPGARRRASAMRCRPSDLAASHRGALRLGEACVQAGSDLIGGVRTPTSFLASDDDARGDHARETHKTDDLPPPHLPRLRRVPRASISLEESLDLTRTGDLWIFRGHSLADRTIQVTTNSPVNHVGMSVVIADLPPLMWHAELGKALPDLWSGKRQRGVQLHDLRDAVLVWARRYGQRAWLRQLETNRTRGMEDAVLRTIARLDGTPFPSTARLAAGWFRSRLPARRAGSDAEMETAYCAEVVATTYQAMGLLPAGQRPGWYDPGRFWSGDDLALLSGSQLGGEIEVRIPSDPGSPHGAD